MIDARDWMLEHRFNRYTLAQLAGVTPRTVTRWLTENEIPQTIRRLVELESTTHALWPGWWIHKDRIYAPTGAHATQGEILGLPYLIGERNALKSELQQLRAAPVQYLIDW